MLVSEARHSHIDIISLHDATEVLIGGKDTVETVVVDVSYNHLVDKRWIRDKHKLDPLENRE